MIKLEIRQLLVFEVVVALALSIFILDLIPKNHNDFNNICSEAWQNDAKQYETCMLPYHKQAGLSRNVAISLAVVFVGTPICYFTKRNRK